MDDARMMAKAIKLARERRWVRVRLAGWGLIGGWQALSLLSEFVPLDLESQIVRIAGKVLGLVGLLLIAYGFERLVKLAHEGMEEEEAKAARTTKRTRSGRGSM